MKIQLRQCTCFCIENDENDRSSPHCCEFFSNHLSKKQGRQTDATSTSSCFQILFQWRFPPGGDTLAWVQTARDEFDSHYAMWIKNNNFNGKQLERVQLIKIKCFDVRSWKILLYFCKHVYCVIILFHQLKVWENSTGSLKRPLAFACQPGLSVAAVHLMTLIVTRGESPLPETQTVRRSPARVA